MALKAPYASSASAVFMLRLKSGTCFLLLTSPYSVNWLTCVEIKPHVAGQSHPSGWLAEAAQSLDLLRTTAQCLGQPELGVIWH